MPKLTLFVLLSAYLLNTSSFQRFKNYPTATGPVGVAIGDFNGDGKADLAVSTYILGASVLFGHGDGTFSKHHDYPTSQGANGIAAADLNRDGKLDLVVTNPGLLGQGTTLSVLLGNGDGTFQPHVDYTTGTRPEEIAIGDFNGDGKVDLAVANFLD